MEFTFGGTKTSAHHPATRCCDNRWHAEAMAMAPSAEAYAESDLRPWRKWILTNSTKRCRAWSFNCRKHLGSAISSGFDLGSNRLSVVTYEECITSRQLRRCRHLQLPSFLAFSCFSIEMHANEHEAKPPSNHGTMGRGTNIVQWEPAATEQH